MGVEVQFYKMERIMEMEGGDREAECKRHITLGLDTQMHRLPPPAGSTVLLGHFHRGYAPLTVLSKVLH